MQPIPTINVNLTTCKCAGAPEDADPLRDASGHIREFNGRPYCAAAPVLIPCPIPRSVTFEVVLGTCFCTTGDLRDMPQDSGGDLHICPARPIRVSCFIDGEAWPETEVGEIDVHESQNPSAQDTERILAACRERWALVKALLLGTVPDASTFPACLPLIAQRDAVFSALVDAARLSIARAAALNKASKAAGLTYQYAESVEEDSEPAIVLADYVERIVEQVGVLAVAP